MSFLSERVNAIRASWASRCPGSLRAKKKREKETGEEKRSWAGTSGRQDTSSSVLIAANACGMQHNVGLQSLVYVIMAPFVASIVVVAAPMAGCGYAYALPCRCECAGISVCLCVCVLAKRLCVEMLKQNIIVPAMRKSNGSWQTR